MILTNKRGDPRDFTPEKQKKKIPARTYHISRRGGLLQSEQILPLESVLQRVGL